MKTQLFAKLLSSNVGLSSLILRVPVGLVFACHGSQKLFGWLGGYGLEGTGQWMASIGSHPGVLMALLAGSAEFFGGLALALGLLTRPAALATAFTMLMALPVHLGNGVFVTNNGYEYALTLLVASLALMIQGAGRYSVDAVLKTKFDSKA